MEAAQKKKDRCVLRDRTTRIEMKSSQRARGKSMKIDRRMRAFTRAGQLMKLLFRITSTRIENSQAKMFRALRCHQLLDGRFEPPIGRDRPAAAPRISGACAPDLPGQLV